MSQKVYAWELLPGNATTWTVPSDWNSSNNTIEAIGCGGLSESSAFVGSGSGGGAYSRTSNIVLVPGSTVYMGGESDTVEGSIWFCTSNDFPGNSNVGVRAYNGERAENGGFGGNGAQGIGEVKYWGGSAGSGDSPATIYGFGGGGGAAGPSGNGRRGGDGWQFITDPPNPVAYATGGGGGGAGGGSSTVGANATANVQGNGGQGPTGLGGGIANSIAYIGGGGVGSDKRDSIEAGAGGDGVDLGIVTHSGGSTYSVPIGVQVGAGGGGGGGSQPSTSVGYGGNAGQYGGGQGGYQTTNTNRSKGLIVITYTPASSSGMFMLF